MKILFFAAIIEIADNADQQAAKSPVGNPPRSSAARAGSGLADLCERLLREASEGRNPAIWEGPHGPIFQS